MDEFDLSAWNRPAWNRSAWDRSECSTFHLAIAGPVRLKIAGPVRLTIAGPVRLKIAGPVRLKEVPLVGGAADEGLEVVSKVLGDSRHIGSQGTRSSDG